MDKTDNIGESPSVGFKTVDGQHLTGLVDDPSIEIIDRVDDMPLSMFPSKNLRFMKALPKLGATVDSMTVPNQLNYTPCCGATTN